jgi:peroxiredoxin
MKRLMKMQRPWAVMALAMTLNGNSQGGWLERVSPPLPAPVWTLTDTLGATHSLGDLAGHVVLVNFWATWCSPCLEEMPSIMRLRKRVGEDKLVILGISVDEPVRRVRRFGEQFGLDFPLLIDPDGEAYRAWKVKVYPSSFLLDGMGRIRFQAIGPVEWDNVESIDAVNQLIDEATVCRREEAC